MYDYEIGEVLPNIVYSAYWDDLSTVENSAHLLLPFPTEWHLDENGLQIDWRWNSWTSLSEEFGSFPWHYAD